jgi:hypothetical protein
MALTKSGVSSGGVPDPALRLRMDIAGVFAALAAIPPELASRPIDTGKWSPVQIVGHLVDSASNNHGRFVRARIQDDLVFDGYEQDAWVTVQQYESASWLSLLELWRAFNLHLARVMAVTPLEVLDREHSRHSFDRIAFNNVAAGESTTLRYLMIDYVDHLEHHLRQILVDPWRQQVPKGTASQSSAARWPAALDPLSTAPGHHKLVFETANARVLDTHIAPGDTVPLHVHRWPAVLHVLSWSDVVRRDDNDVVVFDSRTLDGLPGRIQCCDALPPHTLENVGGAPLHILAVEVKGPFTA